MKKNLFFKICFSSAINRIFSILILTQLLSSCNSDDISEDSYYTFLGYTINSYCKEKQNFTIFSKLLEDTGADKLLSCYGHYTCFLPTDSAFEYYFAKKHITYDSLSTKEKKKIVFDHLISSKTIEYTSNYFEEGTLPVTNMNYNNVNLSFQGFATGSRIIYVNKTAPIIEKDIKTHNGVIHIVGRVVEPPADFLPDVLKKESNFTIFSTAMEMTHLGDSIKKIFDDNYVAPPKGLVGAWNVESAWPKMKKYGYTVFAETDSVFSLAGINSIEDLKAYAETYYGVEDQDDPTSRKNALNKFISYHMLDRKMASNVLVYNGKCTVAEFKDRQTEYYETFLKYRLMQIMTGNKINTTKDQTYVGIEEYNSNLQGINGYVHTLKNILVYDEDVMQNDVLNKRIRYDVLDVAPEFTNNNIRWNCVDVDATIPAGYGGELFKYNDHTAVYCWGDPGFSNYHGEEVIVSGWFDITFRCLPVPPGTYEVRLGYVWHSTRGTTQFYFDNKIVGIPVDMGIDGSDPKIGWVPDEETTDNGIENDKMMRNRGYMKGATSITSAVNDNDRDKVYALRIIVGTFTFQEYGYHSFRGKNVESEDKILFLDYVEFVPTSYLIREGKD